MSITTGRGMAALVPQTGVIAPPDLGQWDDDVARS